MAGGIFLFKKIRYPGGTFALGVAGRLSQGRLRPFPYSASGCCLAACNYDQLTRFLRNGSTNGGYASYFQPPNGPHFPIFDEFYLYPHNEVGRFLHPNDKPTPPIKCISTDEGGYILGTNSSRLAGGKGGFNKKFLCLGKKFPCTLVRGQRLSFDLFIFSRRSSSGKDEDDSAPQVSGLSKTSKIPSRHGQG